MINIISVDVEEYFHPSELEHDVSLGRWNRLPSRVESETLHVLDLFAKHRVQGTFFILGWVAERNPRLVRRIAEAGHEIACHSHLHRLVYNLTPAEFREDTQRAVSAIASACGVRPHAYRAPSYSITAESLWALEILVECGFTHDSSIYPISHDRYGIPGFGRFGHATDTPSGPILEVPIATVKLGANQVAPVGGGAYMRLLPYCYTAAGVRRINNRENEPACIYFHPWELDPDQPRLATRAISRIRTYGGLKGMTHKLDRLLGEFQFGTLSAVYPAAGVSRKAAAAAN